MKKLAIIGCGGMVYDFIYEYTKNLPMCLEAICGTEEDLDRFAAMYHVPRQYTDYHRLLEEVQPELVIAFPGEEGKQFAVSKACLLAGADVLCERPVCHNIAEWEELAALQKETGRFLMVRYNRRYMPTYLSAANILRSDEFGDVVMYHSAFHAGAYGSEEAFLANHISHHLDLARMLLGEIELQYVRRRAESDRLVAYQIGFESKGGALGTIQANSFLCPDYPMERVELCGSGHRQVIVENVRTLRYNGPVPRLQGSGAEDFLVPGGTRIQNGNCAQLDNYTYYGFEEMLRTFANCSLKRKQPPQDIADAVETFRLVESVKQFL